MNEETRDCYICYGTGRLDKYAEDCETVIGQEPCYNCEGSGKVEDVCHCSSWCACECTCGYDDGNGNTCTCWE